MTPDDLLTHVRAFTIAELNEHTPLERRHVQNLEPLFDLLPDIFFYVKGKTGRWVTCNLASLQLMAASKREEVSGAREESFFPPKVAEGIRQDDLNVLNTGVRITNRIELVPNEKGQLVWVMTNKLPVTDLEGEVHGLVGLTRVLPDEAALPGPYAQFRGVIAHIDANLAEPLRVPDLAAFVGLSESHFRRRFREQFGVSAQEFILRARLQAAARLIGGSGKPIGVIGLECGFSDQSYFTRQFTRFFGEPPKHYRLRWRAI